MNKKRKTSEPDVSVDRISELPDDIIAKIMSCLTLKQAAATSVISTRWRYLWKHLYSGFFDFDGTTIIQDLKRQYYETSLWNPKNLSYVGKRKSPEFTSWVNQVLQTHKGSTIKRFRIIFDSSLLYKHAIDKWITLASSKSVQCLELDFSSSRLSRGPLPSYDFPPSSHCRFQSLTTLSLKYIRISVESFELLLIRCPNLEELNITDCPTLDHAGSPQSFKLYSCSLKRLTLWRCGINSKNRCTILAPNLLSLTYAPRVHLKPNLILEDVPRLNYLEIDYCLLSQFRNHLPQLQELVCDLKRCCNDHVNKPPEFPNLKNLTMKNEVGRLLSFRFLFAHLNAAPMLENLTIERCAVPMKRIWNIIEDHQYNKLKTIKFTSLVVTAKHVKLMNYLVSHAPQLEKIIIDVCPSLILGTPIEISYRQSIEYSKQKDDVINVTTSVPINITFL
ncbi:hypothetical protein ACFE04_002183 [Oxalis oulophora]